MKTGTKHLHGPSCGVVHMDQDVMKNPGILFDSVAFFSMFQKTPGGRWAAHKCLLPPGPTSWKSGCAEWPFFNGETNVSPLNGISIYIYRLYRHTCMYVCIYIYNVYIYI